MAEIHILSTARLESLQLEQLSAVLAEAHAAGVDLGPRAPHIRACIQSLIDLNSKLQEGTTRLATAFNALGIKDPAFTALLEHLTEVCRTLSQSTTSFPSLSIDED